MTTALKAEKTLPALHEYKVERMTTMMNEERRRHIQFLKQVDVMTTALTAE
jgi:hypothetical protein